MISRKGRVIAVGSGAGGGLTDEEKQQIVEEARYGIRYKVNTVNDLNSIADADAGDLAVVGDERKVYQYDGSNWTYFFSLDEAHTHDDRYYTETEIDNMLSASQSINPTKHLTSSDFNKNDVSEVSTSVLLQYIKSQNDDAPYVNRFISVANEPILGDADGNTEYNQRMFFVKKSDSYEIIELKREVGFIEEHNHDDRYANTNHNHNAIWFVAWSDFENISSIPYTLPIDSFDYKNDDNNIFTLSDGSVNFNNETKGVWRFDVDIEFNTNQNSIGDGIFIRAYKNNNVIKPSGLYSKGGSTSSGEEIKVSGSFIIKVDNGDKITFKVDDISGSPDWNFTQNKIIGFRIGV
jgi:hypothetical protein